MPLTPDGIHIESGAMQTPVTHLGHQSHQSVKTANIANLVTVSPSDTKSQMTPHSLVRQPTMDSGETNRCEDQNDASYREIHDYEFVKLTQHHLHRGEAAWNPNQESSTINSQRKPYSYRELPDNLKPTSNDFQPPQPYQAQSFPMYNANQSRAVATTDLGKYLMRREVVSSGLLTFDDKPKNYWAWKASFLNSTNDLTLY